ncbi:GDSL esterase/lipase At1g33811-like [Rutidosis leptorrhynchoides]|uniref:GDSL esterase/lipase At1g33811-like n=1 Tax=Rutidosis leptorrhynchoides TaxID=125765 RepID=UPI003A98E0B1
MMQNLYNANVRRVVVMGLVPIGCAPSYLWQYNSNNGECVKTISSVIMEFNFVMRYTVEELNKELFGANIVFCDAYLGFSITNSALWFRKIQRLDHVLISWKGLWECFKSSMVGSFRPTSAVNEILAENVWSGLHTKMYYPMNMKDMASQRLDDAINQYLIPLLFLNFSWLTSHKQEARVF